MYMCNVNLVEENKKKTKKRVLVSEANLSTALDNTSTISFIIFFTFTKWLPTMLRSELEYKYKCSSCNAAFYSNILVLHVLLTKRGRMATITSNGC